MPAPGETQDHFQPRHTCRAFAFDFSWSVQILNSDGLTGLCGIDPKDVTLKK